ncbi:unnamed protein product [Blepharisma stoltei]|uniref:Uncharacterized protein n=1 Tax=Blepharisma stoltei TaxID=1481888 RepID=A0AAU9J694_9CILI|nr:unnamed protein product [Blepharisma stoltei]
MELLKFVHSLCPEVSNYLKSAFHLPDKRHIATRKSCWRIYVNKCVSGMWCNHASFADTWVPKHCAFNFSFHYWKLKGIYKLKIMS